MAFLLHLHGMMSWLKPMANILLNVPAIKGPGYRATTALYTLLGSELHRLADKAKGSTIQIPCIPVGNILSLYFQGPSMDSVILRFFSNTCMCLMSLWALQKSSKLFTDVASSLKIYVQLYTGRFLSMSTLDLPEVLLYWVLVFY
jgi:hypothetical protein